jgi:predicted transporter
MVTAATSLALAFVVRSDSLYRSSPPHPVKLSQLARVMVVSAQGIDCTAGAIGFFSGIRLPATLIAGSSLATIFALVQKVKADDCKSRLEFGVLQMYHLCSIVAFCLSVTSIMMSTAAGTTLLVGKHNPIAHDVYHFMKREFNFEFVIVR